MDMSRPAHEGESKMDSPIMKYFTFAHLPSHLAGISSKFHTLAWEVENTLPAGPEKTVALRKLLEAKDAAVRTLV